MVIKNCKIIDVYNSSIIEGQSIAITDGYIVGIGDYKGKHTIDAKVAMLHQDLLMVISILNLLMLRGGNWSFGSPLHYNYYCRSSRNCEHMWSKGLKLYA